MPVYTKTPIRQISQEEFHQLDYTIMGIAFDIHNEYGNLYDEKIYQQILASRCTEKGLQVLIECPIYIEYKSFEKIYFVDLLVNHSALFEFKSVRRLTTFHIGQTLNYLLMTGLLHGKVINFGAESVEGRLISTTLTPQDRKEIEFNESRWESLSSECHKLNIVAKEIILHFGAFFTFDMYQNAISHFIGDEEAIKEIEIFEGTTIVGKQKIILLNEDIGFKITSLYKNMKIYEKHLQRWLTHTKLKAIQWINLNRRLIQFITIENEQSNEGQSNLF